MNGSISAAEADLVGLCVALGARRVPGLGEPERALLSRVARVPDAIVEQHAAAIQSGADPLGEALTRARPRDARRLAGAIYTPPVMVETMVAWLGRHRPDRVVDPGAGSGRFVVAAGRRFPDAELWAVEIDPVSALVTRAHLAAAGLSDRARVVCVDYRDLKLDECRGRTAFVGNPPFVRHHHIPARWKTWLAQQASALGLEASRLCGLHAHFILATAHLARAGDYGALVTSAEWLEVNYGALCRRLFAGPLGGLSLHRIDPRVLPFANADTTAVIACFEVGAEPRRPRLRRVSSLGRLAPLAGGRRIAAWRLERGARFTGPRSARPRGFVELGELCAVHRGQVTGLNRIWIEGEHSRGLPSPFFYPSVTRARELFGAKDALRSAAGLRRVIDLPERFDHLDDATREAVDAFLARARRDGAHLGFVARHRRAWWAVGLRQPAPILATYMARRPPAFVLNLAGARHLNIAHGLYPREPLPRGALDALCRYLSGHTPLGAGRAYAGGLTKFEPKEMERLWVPGPELLGLVDPGPPRVRARQGWNDPSSTAS